MSLKKIQKDVDEWIGQYKEGYWTPHEMLACLIEETGELSREINHKFGPKKKKETEKENDMGDEMADIIYAVCCIANYQKIDLDKHWKNIMKKMYTRDDKRWRRRSKNSFLKPCVIKVVISSMAYSI